MSCLHKLQYDITIFASLTGPPEKSVHITLKIYMVDDIFKPTTTITKLERGK